MNPVRFLEFEICLLDRKSQLIAVIGRKPSSPNIKRIKLAVDSL